METLNHFRYRLKMQDSSHAGEARRVASAAAAALGFSATQQGRVAIVATELASNLVKHSRGGELLMQEIHCCGNRGLELTALDSGPGFSDISKVMIDGYSTAGSPGTGLGAIRRLSQTFDAFSAPGSGSVFLSRICAVDGDCPQVGTFQHGGVSVPHPGEVANGDAWSIEKLDERRYAVLVVDGLGHGEFAAVAAAAAVEAFHKRRMSEPEQIVEYIHGALRSTRGAALALALIDGHKQTVEYVGVGNIVGAVVAETGVRRMISYEGTAGHSVRKIQKFTYPWPADAHLIMHTDGLSAHWDLAQYPGLLVRHPSIIAAVLYRDGARKNDDATVLVARGV